MCLLPMRGVAVLSTVKIQSAKEQLFLYLEKTPPSFQVFFAAGCPVQCLRGSDGRGTESSQQQLKRV